MALRFPRPVPDFRTTGTSVPSVECTFYPVPARPYVGWSVAYCIERRDAVVAAIDRAVESGVAEYHIGSRGLKRFTLKELTDLLHFWMNAANDAAMGVAGSSIQSRRAIPCDA